jgi:murein DD-endopeptidase MepM/ murein hydrolase activator NlpD
MLLVKCSGDSTFSGVLAMALRVLFLYVILVFSSSCATTISYKVDLSDTTLSQGGVAALHLKGEASGQGLSASFTGGEVFALETEDGVWGIVAVDLETKPGSYKLTLERGDSKIQTTVEVVGRDYGTERLRLPPGMVELDVKTLERVKKEAELISTLWTGSYRKPLWSGSFIMPVEGKVTGYFGARRIFNGIPRSPHGGVDIAAPEGTPVKAANRGRVVFVGDFFFNGRFVVVDHGLGVFTVYTHLSVVQVESGLLLEKGTVVGEVGATGRATGPHLHFSVKVGNVRVSPTQLFEITERLWELLPKEASR